MSRRLSPLGPLLVLITLMAATVALLPATTGVAAAGGALATDATAGVATSRATGDALATDAPAGEAPAGEATGRATGDALATDAPAGEASLGDAPAAATGGASEAAGHDALATDALAGVASVGDGPPGEAPAGEALAGEAAGHDALAASAPAGEASLGDGPPGEASVGEALATGALATGALATGALATDAALWRDGDGDGLQDRFEERWGATLSTASDSDGDGLIDAAEDLDGDGLGGLGEQRYGTLPLNPDSDGDGTPDGDEDTDGDGRTDAQQQDQRRLPGDLRPTTEMAYWDRPSNYVDRCHNDAVDSELHPCSLAAGAAVRVVLFGDSHALQWLPSLAEASLGMGWEVVALTKAACPPAQVEFARKEAGAGPSCVLWRNRALLWLAAEQPSLVILSGAGRAYKLVDGAGERMPADEAAAGWRRGLAETLDSLPEATTAVVLADTPLMQRNPVTCLEANPADVSACLTPRSVAIDPALDAVERDAAEASGATFESLNELVCPYNPCPAIVGDVLLWRNADHITATYAQLLAPSMRELVRRHLAAGAGGVAPEESGRGEAAVAEPPEFDRG